MRQDERRIFWKKAYIAAIRSGKSTDNCEYIADKALKTLDAKFAGD